MKFDVKALGVSGQVLRLSMEAADARDAERLARAQGVEVIAVRAAEAWRVPAGLKSRRSGRFDLLLFSQELLALLEAGLSLVEATEALVEKEQAPEAKRVLDGIITALYEGVSFSQALAAFPDVFPELLVATLRASERTGDLPQALQRFIAHEERMREQKNKVVSALFYPAVVMGVALLVTVGLLWFLVPRFASVYEENTARNLPFLSRMVIQWGKLVTAYPGQTVLGAVTVVVVILWIATRPGVQRLVMNTVWQSKAIGSRLRIFELSRFYRATGMLLRGGIPAMTAFGMVGGLLHPTLRGALLAASGEVKEGRSMSDALAAHGLTTPIALRMLRVGERTGGMGEMMERIAVFYDQDVDRWLAWFGKALSPILLVVLGIFVGGIVVMLYLPIFEIAGSLG
ncbi:MAG TPA: type II secretion system F family protein [Rhodocyclaceae bacterium]|nr:type II secretion system F family protein [Rhodocyclaceae bacterium]